MKRYSGQKALYEAMSGSRPRRRRLGLLERLTPQLERVGKLAKSAIDRPKLKIRTAEPPAEKPAPAVLKPARAVEPHEAPGKAPRAQKWLRPKAVQLNAGRIEISLPYQLGIAIGLLVIVAMLVAYQLGQIDRRARYKTSETSRSGAAVQATGSPEAAGGGAPVADAEGGASSKTTPARDVNAGVVGNADDHVIVLAQHAAQADLTPVQEFFAEKGIRTSIYSLATLRTHFAKYENLNANVVPKGDGFMLVYGLCDNPDKKGTNGYAIKQKIIELGAQYKAPRGRESFARHRFSDAYGMKVK